MLKRLCRRDDVRYEFEISFDVTFTVNPLFSISNAIIFDVAYADTIVVRLLVTSFAVRSVL